MLTPKLRFPEFRNRPGWDDTTVGSQCTGFSGGTPDTTRKEFFGGSIPFIRSAEIGQETTQLTLTEAGLSNSAAKVVNRGDVLVALYGANSGDVALAQVNGAINQAILCLRPVGSSPFLYQYLSARQKWIIATYLQGGQGNLSGDIIKSVPFLIPSLAEQQKIADCLTSLDELIAAQGRKVAALSAHKKGLMQQLFPRDGETVPRLRFPEFRDGPEWEERQAGSLLKNRITKGEIGLPIYSVTMHDGMVRRDSFDRNFYDIEDAAGNKKACKNDIAYNMMRMWQGAMGVAPEDCLVSPAYVVLAPSNDAVPQFFAYFFKLPISLELLTAHSRGLTKDRLRLYYDDFSRMLLRCPAPAEQHRIAACLGSMDARIAAETEKLAALRTHKKGLMQQLFPSAAEAD
jgi:type I restriction enzyme S subunit